jgi:uncharacterized membrane protein
MNLQQAIENLKQAIELIGTIFEVVGVGLLTLGAILALVQYGRDLLASRDGSAAYKRLRKNLGNAILLGLEFLVAADIIRTVAVATTLQNVAILGLIVLIRTFLTWSLDVEIEGTWPWRRTQSLQSLGATPDQGAM